ncbi:unnamed protein product [Mycena citricolor]|uniref:FIST domain-containing protein n=1 Tax=Mycena citricolor TaxID=2018698 RepID=A0AAD2H978_9AGAR|nr:unnamed protein product [Mycena citricolor]
MNAHTILSQSPTRLLDKITRLSSRYREHVLLFTLSPNLAPSDLQTLVQRLTTATTQSVGCLSAPLPGQSDLVACSLAFFDRKTCVPFRSEIPGQSPPQVGRWHSFRRQTHDEGVIGSMPTGNFDWQDVWSQSLTKNPLPAELQAASPDEFGTILYLTDNAPEGLTNALSHFSGSSKLGLFALSTPFITGRPVTLFRNDAIFDSGAVGVALKTAPSTVRTRFPGMSPLHTPMVVTHVEGNLVVTLDGANPTQILLSAIKSAGIDLGPVDSLNLKAEEEFAISVLRDGEMYSIESGDPKRGTISLKSPVAPPLGSIVQFFHRRRTHTAPTLISSNEPAAVSFFASPEQSGSGSGEERTYTDRFLAASDNAFAVSRGVEDSWRSSIADGVVELTW